MYIRTFDDFLSENEMKVLEEYFTGNIWEWGHSTDSKAPQRWFHCYFDDKPYFTHYLKEKIERTTDIKCEYKRVYANGQTLLNSGSWHIDTPVTSFNDPPDPNYITALLYISDIGPGNIDIVKGHTEFKINNEIKSVEPLKNRLVVFDSRILHRGCAPEIPGFLRISLAWKLKRL